MAHGSEPEPLSDRRCLICQNHLSKYNEADVCFCHPEYIDRLVKIKEAKNARIRG